MLSWVQTRPYSYATSGLKSGSSSVQQSKGEYKVLNKSNLTLRKGITIHIYGYIKDKAWFICIKLSFYTCKVSFINTFAKDIFSIYDSISEKGLVTILSVAEPLFPQHMADNHSFQNSHSLSYFHSSQPI